MKISPCFHKITGYFHGKEFKIETHNWAYKIKGDDLEGDEGGVVTAIVSRHSCVIITVLG